MVKTPGSPSRRNLATVLSLFTLTRTSDFGRICDALAILGQKDRTAISNCLKTSVEIGILGKHRRGREVMYSLVDRGKLAEYLAHDAVLRFSSSRQVPRLKPTLGAETLPRYTYNTTRPQRPRQVILLVKNPGPVVRIIAKQQSSAC